MILKTYFKQGIHKVKYSTNSLDVFGTNLVKIRLVVWTQRAHFWGMGHKPNHRGPQGLFFNTSFIKILYLFFVLITKI